MPPKRKQTEDAPKAPVATKKNKTSDKSESSTKTTVAPKKSVSKTAKAQVDTAAEASGTPTVAVPVGKSVPPPLRYTGKFDWYSTILPFLKSEYMREGTKSPRYEAVYKKILTYQVKPDFSGRFALRAEDDGSTGAFSCSSIINPLSEEPIEDTVRVVGGKAATVTLSKVEAAHAHGGGTFESGYTCTLKLDVGSSGECGAGMINSGSGELKMHRVWTDGECELFEGFVSFNIKHGPTLRRKGHGPSSGIDTPFWAVRARRDDEGQEIGIDEDGDSY